MYIPKHFENTNTEETIAFMRRYSFGTLITTNSNLPVANHLPFLVEEVDGDMYILTHLAKANPQSAQLAGKTALVIFAEPHAYISPKHYEKEQSVPTWNYMAVHAYGEAAVLTAQADRMALMEKSIRFYEAAYLDQWNRLPDDFKHRMLNGIVAFRIKVTSIEAKSKFSQNRSDAERQQIIKTFEEGGDVNEVTIAEYMKKG